jgi:hypothetical protein
VADGWCWFVLREKYCWLVAGLFWEKITVVWWLISQANMLHVCCRQKGKASTGKGGGLFTQTGLLDLDPTLFTHVYAHTQGSGCFLRWGTMWPCFT